MALYKYAYYYHIILYYMVPIKAAVSKRLLFIEENNRLSSRI